MYFLRVGTDSLKQNSYNKENVRPWATLLFALSRSFLRGFFYRIRPILYCFKVWFYCGAFNNFIQPYVTNFFFKMVTDEICFCIHANKAYTLRQYRSRVFVLMGNVAAMMSYVFASCRYRYLETKLLK